MASGPTPRRLHSMNESSRVESAPSRAVIETNSNYKKDKKKLLGSLYTQLFYTKLKQLVTLTEVTRAQSKVSVSTPLE